MKPGSARAALPARLGLVIVVALTLWCAPARAADQGAGFLQVTGPCGLVFPRDHGPHPGYRTEWWYYTGNLLSETGRRFGFQLTFFRQQLSPPQTADTWPQPPSAWRTHQIYLAHAALTDLSGRRHLQSARASREALGMAGWIEDNAEMQVFLGDWRAVLHSEGQRLVVSADEFAFQLELTPAKDPVPHGVDGYSRKGSTAERASCYYSMTRLVTRGTVTLGGGQAPVAVSGSSWMDHEFSTAPLEPGTVGWDWYAIQLEDGSEFMIFVLRQKQGEPHPASSGTLVDPLGSARHLARGEFAVDVLDTWKSGRSGAVYPSGWRVKIPSAGIDLVITPRLADQEMRPDDLTGITYWEGSVSARGTREGRSVEGQGYVELTGYAHPVMVLK